MCNFDMSTEFIADAAVLPVDTTNQDHNIGTPQIYLEDVAIFGAKFFSFNMFGDNNPSYGLQSVTIVGKRMAPWWSFSGTVLDDGEFRAHGHGGCGPGEQRVDWDFIEAREGNTTTGYVPTANGAPLGRSGVTVASGLDLGSHSASDIRALGLSDNLTAKLSSYAGLKGADAMAQLASAPLHISAADASDINQATHTRTLGNLVVRYDAFVGDGAFYRLPREAQTVLSSVSFQYGNLEQTTPVLWSKVINQDWSGAVRELKDFRDSYPSRRALEADLLAGAMTDSKLHDGRTC